MAVDYKMIGARIKTKRRESGLTQERMAEKLSVTIGYISQVERGVTRVNLNTLAEICSILDTDLSYFVTGTACGQSSYLHDEISERLGRLSSGQKQVVIDLIDSLCKNT